MDLLFGKTLQCWPDGEHMTREELLLKHTINLWGVYTYKRNYQKWNGNKVEHCSMNDFMSEYEKTEILLYKDKKNNINNKDNPIWLRH